MDCIINKNQKPQANNISEKSQNQKVKGGTWFVGSNYVVPVLETMWFANEKSKEKTCNLDNEVIHT